MIDYITGPEPSFSFNYLRLATFDLLPIAVIVLSFVFWLVKALCSRMSSQERKDRTIATVAIIWFLFYPTIVSYLASSVNCTRIEEELRLYSDLEEVCF